MRRDDLSPALRQHVEHLHLPDRQPEGRRGADRRPRARPRRPLPDAAGGTRPAADQGGRHACPRRPHHRPRRIARPHPLHHRDGREIGRRRRLDARRRGRDHRYRGCFARRPLHPRPHIRFLQLPDGRPRLHRRHAADPRHRPHRLPERQRRRPVQFDLRQAAQTARRDAGLPGARLQGRHRLDHRRGARIQSAPAGRQRRRLCRDHGESQARQSADDGCRGAGQPQDGAEAGGSHGDGAGADLRRLRRPPRRPRAGADRPARQWRAQAQGRHPRLDPRPLPRSRREREPRRHAARTGESHRQAAGVLLRLWRTLGDGRAGGDRGRSRFRLPPDRRPRRLAEIRRPGGGG